MLNLSLADKAELDCQPSHARMTTFGAKRTLIQEYRTPALQFFVSTPLHLDQTTPKQWSQSRKSKISARPATSARSGCVHSWLQRTLAIFFIVAVHFRSNQNGRLVWFTTDRRIRFEENRDMPGRRRNAVAYNFSSPSRSLTATRSK